MDDKTDDKKVTTAKVKEESTEAPSSNATSDPSNVKNITSETPSDANNNERKMTQDIKIPSTSEDQNDVDVESVEKIIPNEANAVKEQKVDDNVKSAEDEPSQKSVPTSETKSEAAPPPISEEGTVPLKKISSVEPEEEAKKNNDTSQIPQKQEKKQLTPPASKPSEVTDMKVASQKAESPGNLIGKPSADKTEEDGPLIDGDPTASTLPRKIYSKEEVKTSELKDKTLITDLTLDSAAVQDKTEAEEKMPIVHIAQNSEVPTVVSGSLETANQRTEVESIDESKNSIDAKPNNSSDFAKNKASSAKPPEKGVLVEVASNKRKDPSKPRKLFSSASKKRQGTKQSDTPIRTKAKRYKNTSKAKKKVKQVVAKHKTVKSKKPSSSTASKPKQVKHTPTTKDWKKKGMKKVSTKKSTKKSTKSKGLAPRKPVASGKKKKVLKNKKKLENKKKTDYPRGLPKRKVSNPTYQVPKKRKASVKFPSSGQKKQKISIAKRTKKHGGPVDIRAMDTWDKKDVVRWIESKKFAHLYKDIIKDSSFTGAQLLSKKGQELSKFLSSRLKMTNPVHIFRLERDISDFNCYRHDARVNGPIKHMFLKFLSQDTIKWLNSLRSDKFFPSDCARLCQFHLSGKNLACLTLEGLERNEISRNSAEFLIKSIEETLGNSPKVMSKQRVIAVWKDRSWPSHPHYQLYDPSAVIKPPLKAKDIKPRNTGLKWIGGAKDVALTLRMEEKTIKKLKILQEAGQKRKRQQKVEKKLRMEQEAAAKLLAEETAYKMKMESFAPVVVETAQKLQMEQALKKEQEAAAKLRMSQETAYKMKMQSFAPAVVVREEAEKAAAVEAANWKGPETWSPSRVIEWAMENHPGYVDMFRNTRVNGHILLNLSKQMLQQLGVKTQKDANAISKSIDDLRFKALASWWKSPEVTPHIRPVPRKRRRRKKTEEPGGDPRKKQKSAVGYEQTHVAFPTQIRRTSESEYNPFLTSSNTNQSYPQSRITIKPAPPVTDYELLYCKMCEKPDAKVCTGCDRVWYCSRECQTQDWPSHRESCLPIQSERKRLQRVGRS